MIIDVLKNANRYEKMHPGFTEAFAFLRRPDLKDLVVGRHVIEGDRCLPLWPKNPGRSRSEAVLETHEKYIDIQLVLAGRDDMGWRPKSQCRMPAGAYSSEEDIQFFTDPPLVWQPVAAVMFAVFFRKMPISRLSGKGSSTRSLSRWQQAVVDRAPPLIRSQMFRELLNVLVKYCRFRYIPTRD